MLTKRAGAPQRAPARGAEGLRSVGEEALPSSKSMCSILPIARLLRAGILRGSGFFYDSAFARGALVGVRFIRDSSRRLECPAPAHTEGGGEEVERNTMTTVIFVVLAIVLVFVVWRFVF